MAEILCALSDEGEKMFMPMSELDRERQIEVYEAAGDELDTAISLLRNEFRGGSCFLVCLNDGRKVSFPFMAGNIIEEIK